MSQNDASDKPSAELSPKVTAAVAAGAITTVLVWVASLLGLDVPPEISAAITVLIAGGAAYLKRDPLRSLADRDYTGEHRA